MRKIFTLCIIFYTVFTKSQTNYSDRWEDFFSYNNVKDFVKVDEIIYALADNAVFMYNTQNKEIEKISSVQGLSGETTTAIHYNASNSRLIIGYKNGLIEVIDKDKKITASPEITNFNQTGEKSINDIFEYKNKLYLATPFAIVVYDINNLEFGDTYFIGVGSSDETINQIKVFNDTIYATSPNGIYTANVNNPNLIDFNSWTKQFTGNYNQIATFNNRLYVSRGSNLKEIKGNTIVQKQDFGQNIISLKASTTSLSVNLHKKAVFLDENLATKAQFDKDPSFDFELNNAYEENSTIYLATKKFGIIKTNTASTLNVEEIHPEGPLSNDVFSLDVHNKKLWLVYGGYNVYFGPIGFRRGYSYFNGKSWMNKRFNQTNFNVTDLVHVTIDKNKENKAYISSYGYTKNVNSFETGGLLVAENNKVLKFYNQNNSILEDIEPKNDKFVTVRVGPTVFDKNGNLWVTNVGAPKHRIKKLSPSGQWRGFDISSIYLRHKYGMSDIAIDKSNTLWIGTRQNGLYVFNEAGEKKRSFNTNINEGSLPNTTVNTVAIDKNDRVWMGTLSGLVVYNNASSIFSDKKYDAKPIIILDNGVARKLMGDQNVTSIEVDGANNKWFGTNNSGVVFTNPNGQKTLAIFNKENSPLPSNKINKIAIDDTTGKVYFATSKGLVAYNSKVAPFGEELKQVYAYPNPALKKHQFITIDGRNGTHLPKGTNIKILDVSGNLVYETNVVEGEQLEGGKAIWNKRNLAGRKVASGIYIVLLSTEDGSETSTTKIAIVN